MERVQEGDIVNVVWVDSNIGIVENARVIRIPAGPGDLWQVEKDEKVWAINGNSSGFDCFVKMAEKQPKSEF